MAALGINTVAFISQLISFLIVCWVLQRWVLPIVLKTLETRKRTISEGIENAERARRELAEANERTAQILAQARQESQAIIDRARKAAQQEGNRIQEEAQARAEQHTQQQLARIQQEANRARSELSRLVVNLSIDAAGRVIGRNVNTSDNQRLVEEFVTTNDSDLSRNN